MITPSTARRRRNGSPARRTLFGAGLIVGLAATVTMPFAARAQTDENTTTTTTPTNEVEEAPEAAVQNPGDDNGYVTTTTTAEPSLDVSAFAPVCVRDAPFIEYTIVPVGFTPTSNTATLTFFDRNGNFVEERVVNSLSGRTIFPGASVDAQGNATDWPGWRLADDGVSWIPDPSDSFLREGLTIVVEVNPSATATVTYPPATAACNGPEIVECVPGQNNDGNPDDDCEPVCVPGQNNDGNPDDDCDLPRTGGGPGNVVLIGTAALLAGVLLFLSGRRRRQDHLIPPPSM